MIKSLGGGGGVIAEGRIEFLEKNLALNTIRDVVAEGSTVLNMVDGIVDEYEDQSGIDTGATTATYDDTGDYYSGATDINFIIQSDTTDGSTTIVDSTGNHTITVNGNTQHDTDQAQFGASSVLFDGTGDYLSVPDSADFDMGTGDFTIDMWVRPSSVSGVKRLINLPTSGAAFSGIGITGTDFYVALTANGSTFAYNVNSSGVTVAVNTWYHVALVRSGDNVKLYVDGVQRIDQNLSASFALHNGTGDMFIGAQSGGASAYSGWIDELRIVKGVAKWTTGFTPPTASYNVAPEYTLPSASFSADSTPTNARLVLIVEDVSTTSVLNTDIKAFISRDGGTTFTECTLALEGSYSAALDILCSEDLDISAQPSGTSMVYKVDTFNGKNQRVHAAWLQWR